MSAKTGIDYFNEGFPYTLLHRIGLRRRLTYCGQLVWRWNRHVGKCADCHEVIEKSAKRRFLDVH